MSEHSKIFAELCLKYPQKVKSYYDEHSDDIDIHYRNELGFRNICNNHYLELAQWFITLEPTKGQIDIHCENEIILYNAVINNNFGFVTWLFTLEPTHGTFNIHRENDELFVEACQRGCLRIAKLLQSLASTSHGTIDLYDDDMFISLVIEKGHLNIIKWLHSLDDDSGVCLFVDLDENFHTACVNRRIDIAKYLISLESKYSSKIDIHCSIFTLQDFVYYEDVPDALFNCACKKYYVDVAEYLVSLESTHDRIKFDNDALFKSLCNEKGTDLNKQEKCAKLALLINKINPYYKVTVESNVITSYHIMHLQKDVYKYFGKYPIKHLEAQDDVDCIICLDNKSDILIKLCKCDNDHYYCNNCIKKIEILYKDNECLLCHEKPPIVNVYQYNTRHKRRKLE